jgi:hypothetical protein
MRTILKLDYDFKNIQKYFGRKVQKVFQVYYFKRTYLPFMSVFRVDRTHKGYHIFMYFVDKEKAKEKRLSTLIIQNCFGSDTTRSLYDYLRICRDDPCWNLLFRAKLKNGKYYLFEPDAVMRDKLNSIISKERARYEGIIRTKIVKKV